MQTVTQSRTFLVYYGELTLKGSNRAHFEHLLVKNMQAALRGLGVHRLRRLYGRIWLEQDARHDPAELVARLGRTFGISHIDPSQPHPLDLDAVRATAAAWAERGGFPTFAVRARRVNKAFPHASLDIERDLGALIAQRSGARVDLTQPARTFHVLVLDDSIHVLLDRFPGPGGLPLGSTGRVAVLLSGGIDSPVAAEQIMRRGCHATFVHFHSAPFTDRASVEKCRELAEHLCRHRCRSRLFVVPLGPLQQAIVTGAPSPYRVLLYRRAMLRLAEQFAYTRRCRALVTGESLGQVASQTLENLCVLDSTVRMPVLRPLLTFDKQDIIDRAQAMGTFELSTGPHADCCSFLLPQRPVTRARRKEVEIIEATLDLAALYEGAVAATEVVSIGESS